MWWQVSLLVKDVVKGNSHSQSAIMILNVHKATINRILGLLFMGRLPVLAPRLVLESHLLPKFAKSMVLLSSIVRY